MEYFYDFVKLIRFLIYEKYSECLNREHLTCQPGAYLCRRTNPDIDSETIQDNCKKDLDYTTGACTWPDRTRNYGASCVYSDLECKEKTVYTPTLYCYRNSKTNQNECRRAKESVAQGDICGMDEECAKVAGVPSEWIICSNQGRCITGTDRTTGN